MNIAPLLYLILSAVLFIIMLMIVEKWDPDTDLTCTMWDAAVYSLAIFTIANCSYYYFGTVIEKVLANIFLTILLFCAHTDYKTKFVYRFFNMILNGVGFIFFVTEVIVKKMTVGQTLTAVATVAVFMLILLALHKFKTYGLGDSLALAANSMFLVVMLPKGTLFPIEILLWHYVIAVFLLIFMNITKLNIKTFKLKEEIAFLPQIYITTMLLLIAFNSFLPNLEGIISFTRR